MGLKKPFEVNSKKIYNTFTIKIIRFSDKQVEVLWYKLVCYTYNVTSLPQEIVLSVEYKIPSLCLGKSMRRLRYGSQVS